MKKIKSNPALLQETWFNRLIVKYRAESIYRITDDSIRPNLILKKLIWDWVGVRNKKNKKAREYFKREVNFKFI